MEAERCDRCDRCGDALGEEGAPLATGPAEPFALTVETGAVHEGVKGMALCWRCLAELRMTGAALFEE